MNPLEGVEKYYSSLFTKFGTDPRGVDWKDNAGQIARFSAMRALVADSTDGSLCDFGCGYGAYASYLRENGFRGPYIGVDVSSELVIAARHAFRKDPNCDFQILDAPVAADFVVASGTFNVIPSGFRDIWEDLVWQLIDSMWESARIGIAFNLLLPVTPPYALRPELFTVDSASVEERLHLLGANVETVSGYGLHENTYIARR